MSTREDRGGHNDSLLAILDTAKPLISFARRQSKKEAAEAASDTCPEYEDYFFTA
jgi:hypothetical protein